MFTKTQVKPSAAQYGSIKAILNKFFKFCIKKCFFFQQQIYLLHQISTFKSAILHNQDEYSCLKSAKIRTFATEFTIVSLKDCYTLFSLNKNTQLQIIAPP